MAAAWGRVRAALGVYAAIKKQRTTRQARAMRQLQDALLSGQEDAVAAVVALCQDDQAGGPRRTVHRALGRWRGSTVAGYLRGDDRTYLENFRCSQHRFDDMVMRLAGSGLDKAERREDHPVRRGARLLQKANLIKDNPDLRYKVAACMYAAARPC